MGHVKRYKQHLWKMMMTDNKQDNQRLKITIEELEDEETPLVAEQPAKQSARAAAGDVASVAGQAGKKAAGAAGALARKAWQSDTRRKATEKLADGATAVANRSTELVRDKVAETVEQQARATAAAVEARVREVDWRTEAQQAAVGGLRWLGRRLEALAERFNRAEQESKQ
jgi:hypothetical protein